MAAHQYWRATGIETYATGPLELSEFHLLATATRMDAAATITSSIAPTTGSVSSLQDDNLTTSATWLKPAALTLNWDFGGSPADVTDIRLAGNTLAKFPLIVKVQWSDDNVSWTDLGVLAGITYPGVATKTSSSSGVIVRNVVQGRVDEVGCETPIPLASIVTTYGTLVSLPKPTVFTIPSGAVKDYASGVLGTGRGRVRGTVKVKNSPSNTPVYRKVRLIRERDGIQMREMWSDPVTGAYDFQYIDELQTWIVMSLDYLHTYVPTIADNLDLGNGVEMMP